MPGFKNQNLNKLFKNTFYEEMRSFFILCCEMMTEDAKVNNEKLPPYENELRNKLVIEYLRSSQVKKDLNYEDLMINFEIETPDAYNYITSSTESRADIKIVNADTLQSNDNYYIIECKRIDGKSYLNKAYVKEGVKRFVGDKVKYPSSYKKNLMLGMVIEDIQIDENTNKINELQNQMISPLVLKELEQETNSHPEYFTYVGEYKAGNKSISLHHLFYNFSEVI